MHKIIKLGLGFIYLVFAAVQYNDPDPLLWILVYCLVAGILIYGAFAKVSKKIPLVILVLLGSFSLTLLPGFIEWVGLPEKQEIFGEMVYKKPYIEETREFLGLWIAWFGVFYLYKSPNSVL